MISGRRQASIENSFFLLCITHCLEQVSFQSKAGAYLFSIIWALLYASSYYFLLVLNSQDWPFMTLPLDATYGYRDGVNSGIGIVNKPIPIPQLELDLELFMSKLGKIGFGIAQKLTACNWNWSKGIGFGIGIGQMELTPSLPGLNHGINQMA